MREQFQRVCVHPREAHAKGLGQMSMKFIEQTGQL